MVRRVVEEDVRESPTIVERDDSWIGRTLVALVVIVLLVVGTIWLVNNVGDRDAPRSPTDITNNNENNDSGTDETPVPAPS